MDDYYKILGITPDTDNDEIRRRYRFLAKAYHPDRFTDVETKTEAEKEMQRINEAYSVLSNPEKRLAYDQKLGFDKKSSTTQRSEQTSFEYLQKAATYFNDLIEKWNSVLHAPLSTFDADLIIKRIIEGYSLILQKVYKPEETLSVKKAIEEFRECIGQIIIMNISLGAELATNSLPSDFTILDLQVYTCIPFYHKVTETAKLYYAPSPATKEMIDGIIDHLMGLSLNLCEIYVRFGQSRIKQAALKIQPEKSNTHHMPVEKKETFQGKPISDVCYSCGRNTPTENLTFRQNIGVIIIRFSRQVNGNLCAACAEKYFWRLSGITLLFGWWGAISFFTTPVFLLSNLWNYLRAWKLRPFSKGLFKIELAWKFVTIGTVTIAICIFAFLVISELNYSYNQTADSHQVPDSAPNVSRVNPVVIPTPTSLSSLKLPTQKFSVLPGHEIRVTPTPETNCVLWSSITEQDRGKTMCVWGLVADTYFGGDIFYITFSSDSNAFRFIVLDGYYFEVYRGNCVMSEGEIKTYGSMPYIELGDKLSNCSAGP